MSTYDKDYERYLYDGPEEPYSKGREVKCQFCGKRDLEWGNDGRRWYLIDAHGNPHRCIQSTPEEDFA